MSSELSVLGIYNGQLDGCAYYRVLSPFGFLQEAGFVYDWQACSDASAKKAAKRSKLAAESFDPQRGYNVLHMLRLILYRQSADGNHDWLGIINETHQKGGIIGADFDDDLFNIPEHSPAKADISTEFLQQYQNALRHVDYLTCSTAYLKNQLAVSLNYPTDRIFVVPNLLDFRPYDSEHWLRALPPNWLGKNALRLKQNPQGGVSMREMRYRRLVDSTARPLIIGLQGGHTHYRDWQIVAQPLKNIAAKFGDRVRFLIAGFHPDYLQESLAIATKQGLVWWKSWGDIENHAGTVMNLDINLCPLEDDAFNHSKSPVKWVEGSAAGAASIVSPAVYGEYVAHGQTGFIARNAEEWEQGISLLLENATVRQNIGRMAHTVARLDFNLENGADEWRTAHQSAWRAVKGA
jgi:glycosyltransferase involved in cell wall biosynthesis